MEFEGHKRSFNEVVIRPKFDTGKTNLLEILNAAGTSRLSLTKAGNLTVGGTSTFTGNATASGTLTVDGVTTLTGALTLTGGLASGATQVELDSIADASARIVTLTGNTTMTAATHANRVLLLGEVGGDATLTVTLPAATGSGLTYRFIVSVVNTSDYVINASTNGADFVGFVVQNSTTDSPDLAQPWPAGATDNTITLNGTTSGGQAIGDWLEIIDILTDEYYVTGLVSAVGATEITPFSSV